MEKQTKATNCTQQAHQNLQFSIPALSLHIASAVSDTSNQTNCSMGRF